MRVMTVITIISYDDSFCYSSVNSIIGICNGSCYYENRQNNLHRGGKQYGGSCSRMVVPSEFIVT